MKLYMINIAPKQLLKLHDFWHMINFGFVQLYPRQSPSVLAVLSAVILTNITYYYRTKQANIYLFIWYKNKAKAPKPACTCQLVEEKSSNNL